MSQLLKADQFQPPDDPAVVLAESRETRIYRAVLTALKAIGTAMASPQVATMIGAHNITGIAAILGGPSVSDALKQAYKPIAETFTDAAELGTSDGIGSVVVYDPLVAAAQLSGAQQTFIGSILGPAADTVRQTLVQALRMGADPEEIAESLQAVIGLTPRQAQAVLNFRQLLENGDPQALTRALRDKRYDPTVRSWADGARADPDTVDMMVQRYAERSLAARAQTIARNESLQATVSGIRDRYVQAIGAGRLLESEVTRYWLVMKDEKLCPICASIPLLNLKGVSVLQPYMSIGGPIMAPRAHVNCRCTEKYVTDLSRVTANPFSGQAFPGVKPMPPPAPTIYL